MSIRTSDPVQSDDISVPSQAPWRMCHVNSSMGSSTPSQFMVRQKEISLPDVNSWLNWLNHVASVSVRLDPRSPVTVPSVNVLPVRLPPPRKKLLMVAKLLLSPPPVPSASWKFTNNGLFPA